MWVAQAARSLVVSFSCKRNVTSRLPGDCSALGSERSLLCRLFRSLDRLFFDLIATVLARNLTDVAVLIAIGYDGLLRPMGALTLHCHQITAHGSCILLTLPITKTGKRTNET